MPVSATTSTITPRESEIFSLFEKFDQEFLRVAKSGTAAQLESLASNGLPDEKFNHIIKDSKIDPQTWLNAALEACKAGNVATFTYILTRNSELLNDENISRFQTLSLEHKQVRLFEQLNDLPQSQDCIARLPLAFTNLTLVHNLQETFWHTFEKFKEKLQPFIVNTLSFAAAYGRAEILEILLKDTEYSSKAHLKVNHHWSTPIEYAVSSGDSNSVASLLQIPAVEEFFNKNLSSLIDRALRSKDLKTVQIFLAKPEIRKTLSFKGDISGGILTDVLQKGSDEIYLEFIKYPEFRELIYYSSSKSLGQCIPMLSLLRDNRLNLVDATLGYYNLEEKADAVCMALQSGKLEFALKLLANSDIRSAVFSEDHIVYLLDAATISGNPKVMEWLLNQPEVASADLSKLDKHFFISFACAPNDELACRLLSSPAIRKLLNERADFADSALEATIDKNLSRALESILSIPNVAERAGKVLTVCSGFMDFRDSYDCAKVIYNAGLMLPLVKHEFGQVLNYFLLKDGELSKEWDKIKDFWEEISNNPIRRQERLAFEDCLFSACQMGLDIKHPYAECILLHIMEGAVNASDIVTYAQQLRDNKKFYPLVKDLLTDYCQTIYIPKALKTDPQLENIDTRYIQNFEFDHISPAFRELFKGFDANQIIEFAKEWHRPDKGLPNELRPLKYGQEWHPLFPKSELMTAQSSVFTIEALTTHEALVMEGRLLDHCVRNGSYTSKCVKGQTHILSIRENDEPLATLEVRLVDSSTKDTISTPDGRHLIICQCYGKANSELPKGSPGYEAFEKFKDHLQSGIIKLNDYVWGETAASRQAKRQDNLTDLEKYTGYVMSKADYYIEECRKAFLAIKLKKIVQVPDRKGPYFNSSSTKSKVEWESLRL